MTQTLENRSVLIVDDDEEILTAIEVALTQTGATVMTARDGNQALAMAEKSDPDLIVLDMMLPKRSGFLVIQGLQPRKEKGKRPYVIMVTGNEGKRHEIYARSLGVDEYFSKPFRMERLISTAERLLGAEASAE
jgi:DNA-binding response OmpR family regulator